MRTIFGISLQIQVEDWCVDAADLTNGWCGGILKWCGEHVLREVEKREN